MIHHLAAAAAASLLLATPVAVAGPASAAAAPSPAAGPVNLIGNPHFVAAPGQTPLGWTCEPGAESGEGVNAASEFMQLRTNAPEVPVLPAGSTTLSRGDSAPRAASASSRVGIRPAQPGPHAVRPTFAEDPYNWLVGTPTAAGEAGCAQTVPVRRGARYTLSVYVSGGEVVLATEYGQVSAAGGDAGTELRTTFTTAPNADTVRVRIHGRLGGAPYQAGDAALVGPASRTRGPAAVTGLSSAAQTSRWVRLQWLAAAGATRYEVRYHHAPIGRVSGTSALILGLTAGREYAFTVVAVNHAPRPAPGVRVTAPTAPAYAEPPDAPEVPDVTVTTEPDGTGSAHLTLWPPERVTDGYFVYLDGVRVGWLFSSPAQVPDLLPGPHILQLSAINSAGESPRSAPLEVVVGADTVG